MILRSLLAAANAAEHPPVTEQRAAPVSFPFSVGGLRTLRGLGRETLAGQNVNEFNALTLPWVYACTRLLAKVSAALPLKILSGMGRDRAVAETHPLHRVVHREFMPRRSAYEGWRFLWLSYFLRGNALAQKMLNARGEVVGLVPIRWDRVEVFLDTDFADRIPDAHGELVFAYDPANRNLPRTLLRRDDVLYFHSDSLDGGLTGVGPIALLRESVGQGLAMQEHTSRFLATGANPSGVLSTDGRLGADPDDRAAAIDRLRAQWDQLYSGSSNAGKTAILEDGLSFTPISVTPRDAEFMQARKMNREDVCGVFGVPTHLVGNDEKGDFSIETLSREFIDYRLGPELVNLERAIECDLLTPAEVDRGLGAKFSLDALLRGDSSTRGAFYQALIQAGVMTPNEARRLEELPSHPGGDHLLIPQALALVDDAGQVTPVSSIDPNAAPLAAPLPALPAPRHAPAPAPLEQRAAAAVDRRARLAESWRPALEDLAQRLLAAERRELGKLFDRVLGALPVEVRADPEQAPLRAGLEAFYAEDAPFRSFLIERSAPLLGSLHRQLFDTAAEELDTAPDTEGLGEALGLLASGFAARYALNSLSALQAVVVGAPLDLREELDGLLEIWREERAPKIAQKETRFQARAATRLAIVRGGKRLRWVTRGSEQCPYCTAMSGVTIEADQNFLGEGQELPGRPGQRALKARRPVSHPPLHRGCDCDLAPA